MKFTLYTSFFNGEKFIDELYTKVNEQTYKNWEWYVTDDFSVDNTKEKLILMSSKDRRVKYVEQSKKKEMFFNPHKFFNHAEVIVQLDQDDYPLPKALEVYHHFFTKFPEVVLITCAGNFYNEDGSWKCYHNQNYTQENNMSCGKLTLLRAWKHNPNLNLDFNPNDWRKYFWSDLTILCGIEEHGKVLNLPRNLYHILNRENSISREKHVNIEDVRNENKIIINEIINRRFDNQMDTINRYFEPVYNLTHSFLNHEINCGSEQVKISYYNSKIMTHQKNLLRELFFDFDINFNKLDGDEDYLIWGIINQDDINNFFTFEDRNSIKNTFLVIQNFYAIPENIRTQMVDSIKPKYPFSYQVGEHMIIKLIR
jgi:glycosyltransferase involved in cell wall biosynthesis